MWLIGVLVFLTFLDIHLTTATPPDGGKPYRNSKLRHEPKLHVKLKIPHQLRKLQSNLNLTNKQEQINLRIQSKYIRPTKRLRLKSTALPRNAQELEYNSINLPKYYEVVFNERMLERPKEKQDYGVILRDKPQRPWQSMKNSQVQNPFQIEQFLGDAKNQLEYGSPPNGNDFPGYQYPPQYNPPNVIDSPGHYYPQYPPQNEIDPRESYDPTQYPPQDEIDPPERYYPTQYPPQNEIDPQESYYPTQYLPQNENDPGESYYPTQYPPQNEIDSPESYKPSDIPTKYQPYYPEQENQPGCPPQNGFLQYPECLQYPPHNEIDPSESYYQSSNDGLIPIDFDPELNLPQKYPQYPPEKKNQPDQNGFDYSESYYPSQYPPKGGLLPMGFNPELSLNPPQKYLPYPPEKKIQYPQNGIDSSVSYKPSQIPKKYPPHYPGEKNPIQYPTPPPESYYPSQKYPPYYPEQRDPSQCPSKNGKYSPGCSIYTRPQSPPHKQSMQNKQIQSPKQHLNNTGKLSNIQIQKPKQHFLGADWQNFLQNSQPQQKDINPPGRFNHRTQTRMNQNKGYDDRIRTHQRTAYKLKPIIIIITNKKRRKPVQVEYDDEEYINEQRAWN